MKKLRIDALISPHRKDIIQKIMWHFRLIMNKKVNMSELLSEGIDLLYGKYSKYLPEETRKEYETKNKDYDAAVDFRRKTRSARNKNEKDRI